MACSDVPMMRRSVRPARGVRAARAPGMVSLAVVCVCVLCDRAGEIREMVRRETGDRSGVAWGQGRIASDVHGSSARVAHRVRSTVRLTARR